MKYFNNNEIFGQDFSEFEHTYNLLDDLKLDFEPEDDDLNADDETDQTTLLD